MASIYKNNNIWYLSVFINGKRATRSLKTEDKKVANKLKVEAEYELIAELMGFKKQDKELTFKEISARFLTQKNRSINTQKIYENVYKNHIAGKPLPSNLNSRSIHIRAINACWNWGLKKGMISKAYKLEMDTRGEPRQRTYTDNELRLMFKHVESKTFNHFVRFAYYTGARSGEIRSICSEDVQSDSIVVRGKSGRRMIKLNSQAKKIIFNQERLWNYNKDYVSHKFKKEVRRLGIKNARFHDLRRTFGLNLIKQGMSIYKVSKLLGHKSIKTTEQHYAPLMTVDIEDFTL
ncbi:site-specific integrase [Candidatus Marinimicrobia bacterium]|nr:site-specific integrase [Candidatus Neomarinimicrobiota bacterium]